MKLKLLMLCCLGFGFAGMSQNVNIPDANFKALLLANTNINTNGDAEIQVSEANSYTGGIGAGGQGITDLTGIEAFTEIVALGVFQNPSLTSIDLSQNTKLTQLLVEQTGLTGTLDLSMMTNLTDFKGHTTGLTAINMANGNNSSVTRFNVINSSVDCVQIDAGFVPNNNWDIPPSGSFDVACLEFACTINIPDANFKAALVADTAINTNGNTEIECSEASAFTGAVVVFNDGIFDLTGIEAFTNITGLNCAGNSLASLDVSSNTALVTLGCGFNSLSSLDVSNNLALETLTCFNNQITSLDVSANTALSSLGCNTNFLSSLNVANGNNAALTSFSASSNAALSCIQIDAGFTPPPAGWVKDAAASYSDNCSAPVCTVTIPDANFKAALVADTAINTNGNAEIECSEASAFTGQISFQSANIADMTGLEAFTALTSLKINNNQLTTLDVSSNTALTLLDCGANQLSTLDVSANTQLIQLTAFINNLTTIDVSSNLALETLNVSTNSITSIDVSGNPAIKSLSVDANMISSLDVSNLNNLEFISCNGNLLSTLNVLNNPQLEILRCDTNQLTSLDISNNTALTQLHCRTNALTSIDVSNNVALTELLLAGNSLSSLDISSNTALLSINCFNNQLTSLNVANGNNAAIVIFESSLNPNLTCIQIDAGFTPPSNWQKDAAASYSDNCSTDTIAPMAVCQNITIQLDANGNASITAGDIDNGSTDNVALAGISVTPSSFDCNNTGANTVTLTVTDTSGNTDSCTATVTVEDNIFPTAPSGVFDIDADAGQCSAVYNYQFLVSDNCGVASTTFDVPSGTAFNLGSTLVNVAVTDTAGNVTNSSFTIIVTDAENPTVSQPTDITVNVDAGMCSAFVAMPNFAGTDNCGQPTFTTDAPANLIFPLGSTLVTLTATDGSGNSATTTFSVIVVDNIDPETLCLGTDTVMIPQGGQYIIPDYIAQGDATATDNCSVVSFTQSPVAGTQVAAGDFTIFFESEDAAGNTSLCSLELTVDEILGVNDVNFENSIILYPNPTSNLITVSSEISIMEVTFFDVTGAKVMTGNQTQIDVSTLASGLYLVQLVSENGVTAIKRLIKN